jgi:hypothetical protein
LWNTNHQPERVEPAFEASLDRLALNISISVTLHLLFNPVTNRIRRIKTAIPCLRAGQLKFGYAGVERARTKENIVQSNRSAGDNQKFGFPRATVWYFTWVPKRYIETEKHRTVYEPVFASPILPRWFSNQWLADSLFANANLYFL